MSTISDLLGIPHFTTSNGGTVRRDFLDAVAVALGSDAREVASLTKDGVLALAWEKAHGEEMPSGLYSRGGTVKNETLQGLVEGITANTLGAVLGEDDEVEPDPLDAHDATDFSDLADSRRRRVGEQAMREGQNGFRASVLGAYGRKCSVTAFDVPAALEAAHIAPYMGTQSNDVRNGLCLRSDVHVLFDRHMLAIDERNMRVVLSDSLLVSRYSSLQGVKLHLPTSRSQWPDREALRQHRLTSGLVE